MNKKLLFAAMSLVALTACTNDEFQSKQQIAQESSPIQFEVINNAFTRASMDGDKIVWNANDGDLFTLYHGANPLGAVTGYQNATYKAEANEGGTATLSTPSMILQGSAIMVWPVDTTFRIGSGDNLTLSIPAELKNIENNIPYVSDLVTIGGYVKKDDSNPATYTNKAGYERLYPVYMRPMASQLTLKTDYATTDNRIAELYEGGADGLTGDDAVKPIEVESMDLLTNAGGTTKFAKTVNLKFTAATPAEKAYWNGKVANNAWDYKTEFNIGGADEVLVNKLTAMEDCLLDGNDGCKFLILPQANIPVAGVDAAAVVVNTIYGKVVVAPNGVQGSKYNTATEANDAWYRYIRPTSAKEAYENQPGATDASGNKKTTASVAQGMMQTINALSAVTAPAGSTVQGEQMGGTTTRFVKVLLTHLDMTDLHVKSDKQLRDAARVWKKMGLDPVTVYLDGDTNNEFKISQKTIDVINTVNTGKTFANWFKVKPCQDAAHKACNTIVITDGGDIKDIAFIAKNGGFKADVALNADDTWTWKVAGGNGTFKVENTEVAKIINRGTMNSTATATLKTTDNAGTQNYIPFENAKDAEWNITGATINVQFNVTNYGTVNIASGAQYRQDGRTANTVFINEAKAIPSRFNKENPVTPGLTKDDTEFGLVNNFGVFATVEKAPLTAKIHNYGLIEHKDPAAKTFITTNQTTGAAFNAVFTYAAGDAGNKMGRINLPYDNRGEDNVSISAAGAGTQGGFVSVTIDGEVTGALEQTTDELGNYVNYVIVNAGPTSIASLSNKIKYLEVNMTDKSELAWSVAAPTALDGLMILTDVNIKLGTTVTVNKATYLGADMYVGGTFNQGSWTGYYGNTTGNVETKYITY